MSLHDKLRAAWASTGSMLCVGLDPDLDAMPPAIAREPDAFERFCREIVDATADLACAFKPQVAHFAAHRAEGQLERLCEHIKQNHPHAVLVVDAKRGDIGSTAERYAIELFDRYSADVATVNPYLGTDAVEPILRRGAAFVLCRTSNPGGGDLQNLDIGGRPLFAHVAELVATRWSAIGECGLVVGATYPTEVGTVREIAPTLPFLVPGIGAQGGDLAKTVAAGRTAEGHGLLISSSRAVLYASRGDDFAEAARRVAHETRDAINAVSP